MGPCPSSSAGSSSKPRSVSRVTVIWTWVRNPDPVGGLLGLWSDPDPQQHPSQVEVFSVPGFSVPGFLVPGWSGVGLVVVGFSVVVVV